MKRYRTIVADPPWEISKRMGAGGRRARSTEVPYDFMTLDEIKALPVAEVIWGLRNPGMGGFNGNGQSLGTAEMAA